MTLLVTTDDVKHDASLTHSVLFKLPIKRVHLSMLATIFFSLEILFTVDFVVYFKNGVSESYQ